MSGTVCMLMMLVTLLELSQAQRPSFAGARPPGGLSQKDKYLGTQNTAVENLSGVDIISRFGEDAVPQRAPVTNLPFGASQKPPVGVPLVLPVGSNAVPVQLANRFGGDNALPASSAGGSVQPASGGSGNSVNSLSFSPSSGSSAGSSAGSSSGATFNAISRPVASAASSTSRPLVSNGLPIDAHGDQNYVDYLNSLPQENRPFWFLNYQAIEALRNSTNPNVGAFQTRGSSFAG